MRFYTNHDLETTLCRRKPGPVLKPFPQRKGIHRKTEDRAEKSCERPLPKVLSCRYIPSDKWSLHPRLISNLWFYIKVFPTSQNPSEGTFQASCIVLILKVSTERSPVNIKLAEEKRRGSVLFMWQHFGMLSKIRFWRACLLWD